MDHRIIQLARKGGQKISEERRLWMNIVIYIISFHGIKEMLW